MSSLDFDSLRRQVQQSRETLQASGEELFQARERLKRIEAEQTHLSRYFDAQNEKHRARQEQLAAAQEDTAREIEALRERVRSLEERLGGQFEAFVPLADPRERIEELSDVYPILLLPLRLETRFKQVSSGEGTAHELWVRVYPDDCAVNTFEAALSENEVRDAQMYWAQVWRAGDDEAMRRAAWRNLVASHGPGRALWIERNYRPSNEAEQPTPDANTRLLVIPTDHPPDDATQTQSNSYWSAVWKAGDNGAAIRAAYEALRAAVGVDMAETIRKEYRPINLEDGPPAGLTRAAATVVVAVVKFPSAEDTNAKRRAWSKAPHVDVMPERLVLMGTNGGSLTLQEIGAAIPGTLITGPDPLTEEGEQIRQEGAEIHVSDEIRWMVDFEEALKKGMAFRVTLSAQQYRRGFDRLMVLGVRLSSDEDAGRELIEGLLSHHHFSHAGLSLLRQGTATNNTDDEVAGYSETDKADDSYDVLHGGNDDLDDNAEWFERRDGIWLAQLLGLDSGIVSSVPGAAQSDISDAQAMNLALFPATLGYMMDAMLSEVFSDRAIEFVRSFYTHLVSGRGLVPAIRIGQQPYGVLTTTVYSRMRFGRTGGDDVVTGIGLNRRIAVGSPFLSKLHEVLMRAYGVWGALLNRVAHVGDGGDPHKTLLEILGLHANSVEFDQRYAESLQQVLNTMNLSGLFEKLIVALALLEQGLDVLRDHGYDLEELGRPDLLDKYFFAKPLPIDEKRLIDDQPLSEQKPIRAYTSDGRNYIQWLIDAANTSLETLRLQSELPSADRPNALLYVMLRHALMLGYYDTSVRLYERADLLNGDGLLAARREAPFIHVKQQAQSSESRFRLLYEAQPVITEGQADVRVADYITSRLAVLSDAERLREQIDALERLKDRPTAALGRVPRRNG